MRLSALATLAALAASATANPATRQGPWEPTEATEPAPKLNRARRGKHKQKAPQAIKNSNRRYILRRAPRRKGSPCAVASIRWCSAITAPRFKITSAF